MKYKSEIFEVIHQDATANFEIGAITPAQMREFDEMCLVRKPEPAQKARGSAAMKRVSAALV